MIVVAYFTDDEIYGQHAELLKASLDKHGLSYDIEPISPSSWLQATAFKPTFIKKKLEKYDEPLIYVDIDAVVHENFELDFQDVLEDIVVHYTAEGELLSGVIYFKNNEAVKALVDRWIEAMEQSPGAWDQKVLQELLSKKVDVAVGQLPVEYVYIFDKFKELYPDKQPIIEHLQASREMRYWQKSRTLKYRILRLFGVYPKVNKYLSRRRERMKELTGNSAVV